MITGKIPVDILYGLMMRDKAILYNCHVTADIQTSINEKVIWRCFTQGNNHFNSVLRGNVLLNICQ